MNILESINAANAFWIIGDGLQVWSSAQGAYVDQDSPEAVAFLEKHGRFLRSPDETTLAEYLSNVGAGVPPRIIPSAVIAERERRLALGFDYNFGDERGVHRIGTTDADLAGWREVTDVANAAIATGAPSAQIAIATNTGACIVTAIEWQSILLAAAAFRQPLWAASFALQAMDPIPSNYTDDSFWEAA